MYSYTREEDLPPHLIVKDLSNEIVIVYRYFNARYSLRNSAKRRHHLRRNNGIRIDLPMVCVDRRGRRFTIEGI